MAFLALVGVAVVGLASALPATFEPRMPPAMIRQLAGRWALTLLAGAAAFVLLSRVTSFRIAWAAGLSLWAAQMTTYYMVRGLHENRRILMGVAALVAGSCAWFIALVARADSGPLRATRLAVLALAACISVVGVLVVTRSRAPWIGP